MLGVRFLNDGTLNLGSGCRGCCLTSMFGSLPRSKLRLPIMLMGPFSTRVSLYLPDGDSLVSLRPFGERRRVSVLKVGELGAVLRSIKYVLACAVWEGSKFTVAVASRCDGQSSDRRARTDSVACKRRITIWMCPTWENEEGCVLSFTFPTIHALKLSEVRPQAKLQHIKLL